MARRTHYDWNPSKLRERRESLGYTQEEAAAQLAVVGAKLRPPLRPSAEMVRRHERGKMTPGNRYQAAYVQTYQVATPDELGFVRVGLPVPNQVVTDARHRPYDDLSTSPYSAYSGRATRDVEPTSPAHDLPGGLSMAADDSAEFFARARGAAGSEAVELLYNEVRRVTQAYGDEGPGALLPGVLAAQRFAFRSLDGPSDPQWDRDLYFLAAVTCGHLALFARDLGQVDAAITQTRTALLCAERAGHPGLQAWVRNEQCSLARWAGWHHDSLRYALLAREKATGTPTRGSVTVSQAVREARAHAAVGDEAQARATLVRADALRDHTEPDDLDELGGLLRFSEPDSRFVVADAMSLLPDAPAAEQSASEAVDSFDEAPAADKNFANEAGARIVLSLARSRLGDADGAADALRPVLDLPPRFRLFGIRNNVVRVRNSLDDTRYQGSPTARDLTAEIEAFSQEAAPGLAG